MDEFPAVGLEPWDVWPGPFVEDAGAVDEDVGGVLLGGAVVLLDLDGPFSGLVVPDCGGHS